MKKNRRRFLLSTKFQMIFGFYTAVTMIVAVIVIIQDYIQIFVPVFMTESAAERIGTPVKILLLPGWVILSFLVLYMYLSARMLGVFKRISETCEKIISGENIRLAFRSKDSFGFLAESFNRMVDTLQSRQKTFLDVIVSMRKRLSEMSQGKKEPFGEIKELIKDIDEVVFHEEAKDSQNDSHQS